MGSGKRVSRSNPGRDRPCKKRKYELVESNWGVKTTSEKGKTTLERLVYQDGQEEDYDEVQSQEDFREDPGGMVTTRVRGQDQPTQDPDISPPSMGGDPPPPP